MKKKIMLCLLLLISLTVPSYEGNGVKAATIPVIKWEGMQIVKGQVGMLKIVKPMALWKKVNNKLTFVRQLKAGEKYRVYQYSPLFGGQYSVGGAYFVSKRNGYFSYKTTPLDIIKRIYPQQYGTKLQLGRVINEQSTVIAPGVTQTKLSVDSGRVKEKIYVLGVDQGATDIKFETALSKDQIIGYERVSSMAARNQAEEHFIIGGVNGDYFDEKNGAPTDLTVHNGEVVTTNTTPASERTIFGVTKDGKALIGNPEISLALTVNGKNPYPINSVNKRRFADHLVLYTPYFAKTTMTNEIGTEVVLNNIQGQLNGNNTVKATVKEVSIGKGNTTLSKGEFVLSGHGKSSDYLKNLTAGQEVEISLSYDQPAWDKVDQALGGRYYLVKKGQAQYFNVAGTHPRTAVGIKQDGSVFVTVIDGRQNESGGVSLTDLAKLMKDLGAVEAMSFDGGGSSTMIARQPGDSGATVTNSPSDGAERKVADALMIVGHWKLGPLHTLQLSANDLKLFAGATYKNLNIAAKGFDINNNPITVSNPLIWSSSLGTFNADGSFTAGKMPAKGVINAASGSIKASVDAEVTNHLDEIGLSNSTIIVDKNGSIPVPAEGYLKGKKVVTDPSVFTYKVSGNIGTVENGIFKAGGTDGTGMVAVSYGSLSTHLQVIVGNPASVVVESFESVQNPWKTSGSRYQTVFGGSEKHYVKDGTRSLKIGYDFTGTNGTSGVYANPSQPIALPGVPVKIGMWVYGDGKGHWLRSQLKDASNREIMLDYTKSVDWIGWKYVEAPIPAGYKAPYRMETAVRYMEVNNLNKNKGQIFIDQITAVYQ